MEWHGRVWEVWEEEIARHDACEHDWQPAPELDWLDALECSKCGWAWLFATKGVRYDERQADGNERA